VVRVQTSAKKIAFVIIVRDTTRHSPSPTRLLQKTAPVEIPGNFIITSDQQGIVAIVLRIHRSWPFVSGPRPEFDVTVAPCRSLKWHTLQVPKSSSLPQVVEDERELVEDDHGDRTHPDLAAFDELHSVHHTNQQSWFPSWGLETTHVVLRAPYAYLT
jgi:hypothetical protein